MRPIEIKNSDGALENKGVENGALKPIVKQPLVPRHTVYM